VSDIERYDAERADRAAIDPELSTRLASAQATPGTVAARQAPGRRPVGY
jgi:hypothetical protein